jgi:uncharacterized membrane protein
MTCPASGRRDEFQLERLIFFSDAVFAIAMTLLTVDLKVPEIAGQLAQQELPLALGHLWPRFASFGLSYLVVALFWISHHQIFGHIQRFDYRLAWLNLLYLFGIAFLPFPTAMLGMYGDTRYATVFYAATVAVIGFFKALLWRYASHGQRLVGPQVVPAVSRAQMISSLIVPVVFLISIPVAWAGVQWAQVVWGLLALYNVVHPEQSKPYEEKT